jgi:hypothetical protein
MKAIVTGDDKQVDLLIRENRVKISRGLLNIEKASPVETPKANPKETPKKTDPVVTSKKMYSETGEQEE